MKKVFSVILGILSLAVIFTSCEKNSPVVANFSSIVLTPGESVQVEISGGSASVNVSGTQWAHESDSIFSLSDFKKHSVVVTGNNVGKDTLRLFYNQGTHANGEFLSIPVSVEK